MKIFLLSICILLSINVQAQLLVADTLSDVDLVQTLAGPGLTISNVVVDCPQGAYGQYFGDNTDLGLSEGVLLTTGDLTNAIGPNNQTGASTQNGAPGDADLDAIATAPTNDACFIEFDLETIGDSLAFNFAFASEEYLEFVGFGVNDVFAFFISGPGIAGTENIALIPGTNTPIAIDNVNDVSNSIFYVDNGDGATAPFDTDPMFIQYDGRTTNLQAIADGLLPCQTYHLKLAIADVQDDLLDSGVFLEAGSFTSNAVLIASSSVVDPNYSFSVEGCVDGQFIFTLPQALPTDFTVNFQLGGTATEGLDYDFLPDSIVIAAGDTSATLNINVLADVLNEGVEELIVYLLSPCGSTPYDSAILEIYDRSAYELTTSIDNFTGCVGSNATLNASVAGFINHSWSPATYLTSTSGSSVNAVNVTDDITYTVTANLGTCVFDADVALDVNPLFSSLLPQIDTSCTNGSVSLTANHSPASANVVNYVWSPVNVINDPTLQTIVAFPQTTTDFIVEMTTDSGCTVTDTITVEVLQGGPNVIVTPSDTLICPGQSVNLQAEVFEECLLILEEFDSFGDGWNGALMEVIQNGVVVGSMTLEGGSSGVDSITVLQGVSAQINFTNGGFPNETSYNLTYSDGTVIFSDGPFPGAGNVFTFTPNCGVPVATYTFDWVAGNGLNTTTGANVIATPGASSNYIVNADGGICTGTGFAGILVDLPAYDAFGDTICIGDTAQLGVLQTAEIYNTCAYTLTLNSDFGWFGSSLDVLIDGEFFGSFVETNGIAEKFDIPTTNQSSIELVFNEPAFGNGETVQLRAPDGTVTFNSNNPSNGSIFIGTASCIPTTEPGLSCQFTLDMQDSFGDGWNGGVLTLNVNGVDVSDFSAAGFGSVANFELNDGDNYSLSYTAGAFENENSYTLFDPSGTALFADGPNPSTGLVFSGTATSVGCTVVPPDISFVWEPAALLIDNTVSSPEAPVSVNTEFYLSYTYGYSSCTFNDTTMVEVIDPTVYEITNDTVTCSGESVQLSFTDWGSNAIYSWTPLTNINNPTIHDPIVSPVSATTYIVDVTLGNCNVSDAVFVDVLPVNMVDFSPNDTAACEGDILSLTANAGLSNYEWNFPDGSVVPNQTIAINTSGFYFFTFDGTNGCRGTSDSIQAMFLSNPSATVNNGVDPVQKCASDSVLLFANGQPNYSYQWMGNAQTGPNYMVFDEGIYTLNVSANYPLNNLTCDGQYTVEVVNVASPVIDLLGLPDVLCCGADTIVFDPYSLPNVSPTDSVFWNGTYVNGSVNITVAGSNSLEIMNTGGCNSAGTYDVDQFCLNPVIMAPDTLEINQTSSIDVSTDATSGTITSYTWTPAGLFDAPDMQNPNFRSDVFGDNPIDVSVEVNYSFGNGTEKNCIENASSSIFVTDEGSIQMPSAFSPNGDGVNDTFGPVVTGNVGIRSFAVYNRWGQLVYRYSDNLPSWDGSFEGLSQPVDVYTYYIAIELPDGSIQYYSGTLTLIL